MNNERQNIQNMNLCVCVRASIFTSSNCLTHKLQIITLSVSQLSIRIRESIKGKGSERNRKYTLVHFQSLTTHKSKQKIVFPFTYQHCCYPSECIFSIFSV